MRFKPWTIEDLVVGANLGDMHCTTLTELSRNGGKGFFGPDLSEFIFVGPPVESVNNPKNRRNWAKLIEEACGRNCNKSLYVIKVLQPGVVMVAYYYDFDHNGGMVTLYLKTAKEADELKISQQIAKEAAEKKCCPVCGSTRPHTDYGYCPDCGTV